jgi:Ser/Thr protein kinase RdoA (MazF antagonist)
MQVFIVWLSTRWGTLNSVHDALRPKTNVVIRWDSDEFNPMYILSGFIKFDISIYFWHVIDAVHTWSGLISRINCNLIIS